MGPDPGQNMWLLVMNLTMNNAKHVNCMYEYFLCVLDASPVLYIWMTQLHRTELWWSYREVTWALFPVLERLQMRTGPNHFSASMPACQITIVLPLWQHNMELNTALLRQAVFSSLIVYCSMVHTVIYLHGTGETSFWSTIVLVIDWGPLIILKYQGLST